MLRNISFVFTCLCSKLYYAELSILLFIPNNIIKINKIVYHSYSKYYHLFMVSKKISYNICWIY